MAREDLPRHLPHALSQPRRLGHPRVPAPAQYPSRDFPLIARLQCHLYASIRQTLGESVAPAYEPPPVEPAPAPVTLPAPPPPKPLNPTIIAAPHADERTTDGRTIEMMLTTVNTSRELADEPALVQNGRLNYVADRIADDFAANSRPCNDAEAAKRLADHGDTELSDVRSICISTDTYAQFGNAWADAYRPGGNRLGMSHIESNGKHFWVILLAKE